MPMFHLLVASIMCDYPIPVDWYDGESNNP